MTNLRDKINRLRQVCRLGIDNKGLDLEDSIDVKNVGACQRTLDSSLGGEQWK